MLYLDFNKTYDNNNKDTTANIDIQTVLPTNFTKLSVSKLDLNVNLPFMTVQIENPQIYYQSGGSERYNYFSQDDGYYQLKNYKIYYCDNEVDNTDPDNPVITPRYEVRDIYFKNYEFENNNVGEKDAGSGLKIYDNFNNYFVINHFNSFLKSINDNINKLLYDMWGSQTDADNLQTLFYTDTDKSLNCFMLLDTQTGSYSHTLTNNPTTALNDTTGKTFCLGFSQELYDLLLSPFTFNKFNYNGINYLAPDNNLVGKGTVFQIEPSAGITYNLIELKNIYYLDYAPTFTSVVLTFNSTVSPLTVNVKQKNFIFNDAGGDTTLSNIPIIQKFQLNRNNEQIFKLIYSNTGIINNYCSINSFNLQRLTLKIMLQDKYGYLYDLKFNNINEYIYAQLAVFN